MCSRMKMTVVERFRSLLQEPFAAVKQMGVVEGIRVADLGAGEGYFTIPSAIVVGRYGFVYSIEPERSRSDRIRARAAKEGLVNVRVLTSKAENLSEIPSGDVDLVFSAFSIHHFEDRDAALREIRRVLRDGGAFYLWDQVPGRVFRWGTRPQDLQQISSGFSRFEQIETQKAIRARFVK